MHSRVLCPSFNELLLVCWLTFADPIPVCMTLFWSREVSATILAVPELSFLPRFSFIHHILRPFIQTMSQLTDTNSSTKQSWICKGVLSWQVVSYSYWSEHWQSCLSENLQASTVLYSNGIVHSLPFQRNFYTQ